MSITRMAASSVVNRIVKTTGGACRLHRVYKISIGDMKYIGQTNRMPEERFKEHVRESSKCTLLKEALRTNNATLDTLAIVGPHDVDVVERIAIALENTVSPDGFNISTGGPGVTRRDEKYEKFRRDVCLVRNLMNKGLVSYDILFMRGDISLTQEEFNAVKRFV
jgi:hypothetical protein